MAWLLQLASGKFHISFRFGGRKYKRSLNTSDPKQAKSRKVRMEDTIRLVELGTAEIPIGVDVATFLMSEGKKVGKTVIKDCRVGEPPMIRQGRSLSKLLKRGQHANRNQFRLFFFERL